MWEVAYWTFYQNIKSQTFFDIINPEGKRIYRANKSSYMNPYSGKGQKISKAIYVLLNFSKKQIKLTILSIFSTQDREFCSFFGRIEHTINCFRWPLDSEGPYSEMEISSLDNLIFSRVSFLFYNIIANCDAPFVVYWSSNLLSSAETWFLSWHLPSIWKSLAIKYKTSLARRWALKIWGNLRGNCR